MKRMMAVIAALALGGVGLAQEGKAPAKAEALDFTRIDANGDGNVTKVEWLGYFAKLDTNKDGLISADEANAAPPAAKGKEGDGAGRKGAGDGGKKNGKGEGK